MTRVPAALALAGLLAGCAAAPPPVPSGPRPEGVVPLLEQTMPVDRAVRTGRLDNGLTFYVRQNPKPEARLELRLVVNAGSVLERDDQQGLAHFVEHMAFNGTEEFARQEMVAYLESIGMEFGPEINAYTGFDETVYQLQVPTDEPEVLDTALRILENWAHRISFAPEEVDKERGVVIEEWRAGRGAGARLRDLQLPVILHGSRYAARLPIGQPAVLDTFRRESLLDFYHTWYRPDLMAVIAVGDCDPQWLEERLRATFSAMPGVPGAPERPNYPVPDHDQALFTVAADPEATASSVTVYHKLDVRPQETIGAYRQHLVEGLYQRLLNQRLYELSMLADPPFLSAASALQPLVRTRDAYVLACRVADGGAPRGLRTLLTEARRARLHGFLAAELEREKKRMMRFMEQAYRERDKTESGLFAEEYGRNFLTGEPIPGIEYEYGLYQTFLPEVELEEVDRSAAEWVGEASRVVAVRMPAKEGLVPPAEEELAAVFAAVAALEPGPYVEQAPTGDLVRQDLEPVPIVDARRIEELGVTEWRLANGVRVVLKPTDFKNDEVVFRATSPGGHSLVDDADHVAALTADAVVREGGVGEYDKIALGKLLAGKRVSVAPWIDELQEGLGGSASSDDLQQLFELIYLYFTAPRADSTAFVSYRTWLHGMIENRSASPEAAFGDTLLVTLSQHYWRRRPWSDALLGEMDLARSMRAYRDRFADASDFTFFFAGSFTSEQLRPLVERYLGNLPATRRGETWRDPGVEPPAGVVERTVYRGLEDKSRTQLVFTGPFPWTHESLYVADAMASVLRLKLRDVLREDLGGTYGVGVGMGVTRYPKPEYRLSVGFGCDPERAEELTAVVFAQLDSLGRFGPDPAYVQKVQEIQRRQHEVDRRENGFWLNALDTAYYNGLDPRVILDYPRLIDALTPDDVRQAVARYCLPDRYVKLSLLPANRAVGGP